MCDVVYVLYNWNEDAFIIYSSIELNSICSLTFGKVLQKNCAESWWPVLKSPLSDLRPWQVWVDQMYVCCTSVMVTGQQGAGLPVREFTTVCVNVRFRHQAPSLSWWCFSAKPVTTFSSIYLCSGSERYVVCCERFIRPAEVLILHKMAVRPEYSIYFMLIEKENTCNMIIVCDTMYTVTCRARHIKYCVCNMLLNTYIVADLTKIWVYLNINHIL